MSAGSFSRLLQFINKQLDLDGQLEVYQHLDRCDICRDAVYQLARDRDKAFLIYRAQRVKPFVVQHSNDAAVGFLGSGKSSQALLLARRRGEARIGSTQRRATDNHSFWA